MSAHPTTKKIKSIWMAFFTIVWRLLRHFYLYQQAAYNILPEGIVVNYHSEDLPNMAIEASKASCKSRQIAACCGVSNRPKAELGQPRC